MHAVPTVRLSARPPVSSFLSLSNDPERLAPHGPATAGSARNHLEHIVTGDESVTVDASGETKAIATRDVTVGEAADQDQDHAPLGVAL
jgi:hypothetical protein